MSSCRVSILLSLILLLPACRGVGPLNLPTGNEVAIIEVYEGVPEKKNRVNEITSPKEITAILGFISENNTNWLSPLDTFPTPKATVVFRTQNKGVAMLLWFGPNWAGGQASPISPKKAYIWEIEENKLHDLKSKLEIGI